MEQLLTACACTLAEAPWREAQTISTMPAARSQSDQAVYANGTIVPASFQPCSSKRPTNSSEPSAREAPIAIPGQASQSANEDELSIATAMSSVQVPVSR